MTVKLNHCGYMAFFLGRSTEIHAKSLYEAKLKAIEFFKPSRKQEHMVHVYLCEKEGQVVVHDTSEL